MKLVPCALVCLSALSAAAGQETLTHSHLVSPAGLPKGWTRVETTYGDVSIGLPPGWAKRDDPVSVLNSKDRAEYLKETENERGFRLCFIRKLPPSSKYVFLGRINRDPAGKNGLDNWMHVADGPGQKAIGTNATRIKLPAGPAVTLEANTGPEGSFKRDFILFAIQKGNFIYSLTFQIPPEGVPYRNQVFEMAKTVKIR